MRAIVLALSSLANDRGWSTLPSEIRHKVVALGDDCKRILGYHRKSVKPVIEVWDRKMKIWVTYSNDSGINRGY